MDSPQRMTSRTKTVSALILVLYSVFVVVAIQSAPRRLPALPAVGLAHAVVGAFMCGVIAVLMLSQARSTGRRGYLMVSGTFLYMTGILVFFPLVFPGAVLPDQQILGGLQSAPSLFYAWHFAFPIGIAVSAFVLDMDQRTHRRPGFNHFEELFGLALTLGGILITVGLVTIGADQLPALLGSEGEPTSYMRVLDILLVGFALVSATVTAACARNGSVITRWLFALAVLGLGEAAVNFNSTGRYSAGWYYSRVFWLVAVGLLFLALLWNLARVNRRNLELAGVDSLTGSESRLGLLASVESEIAKAEAEFSQVALLWLDLDNFKAVNDELGHRVGDEVLRTVVSRLSREVADSDHVGRLGGDEFGILLCDDVDDARMQDVARRTLAAVRAPIHIAGNIVQTTATIGIATAPSDALTADELLLCADLAMYSAKGNGGDRYERFNEDIGIQAITRARMGHDLMAALRNGDFRLHYQPIVEVSDGRMAGVEVLIRWVRDGQVIPAGQFIGYAEQSGQIVNLGRVVIGQLADALPSWFARYPQDFFVTVNLSTKELADQPLIDAILTGPLAAYAQRLVIEVTESLGFQDDPNAGKGLLRLREAGMRIAIDDFGTGFSNFSRLEYLRASILKVDRSLVHREDGDGHGTFLAAAASIAHSLRCDVVAEGVETDAEADVARGLGVRYAQGYYYGRPAPAEAYLSDGSGVPAPRGPESVSAPGAEV